VWWTGCRRLNCHVQSGRPVTGTGTRANRPLFTEECEPGGSIANPGPDVTLSLRTTVGLASVRHSPVVCFIPMSAISVSSLRKIYPGKPPVDAVRGVDLEVHRGECFGVLGPNGAGKTTTIEILEGLLKPTSGDVEILGKSWVTDGDAIRQAIGISLQETQLADKLTVLETVTLFRSFYRSGMEPTDAIR